jgi:hypothetical protein
MAAIMVAILVGVLKCRTRFWKRTAQESFQQSLVEIGSVGSEEKIFFSSPLFLFYGQKVLYYKPESTQI